MFLLDLIILMIPYMRLDKCIYIYLDILERKQAEDLPVQDNGIPSTLVTPGLV